MVFWVTVIMVIVIAAGALAFIGYKKDDKHFVENITASILNVFTSLIQGSWKSFLIVGVLVLNIGFMILEADLISRGNPMGDQGMQFLRMLGFTALTLLFGSISFMLWVKRARVKNWYSDYVDIKTTTITDPDIVAELKNKKSSRYKNSVDLVNDTLYAMVPLIVFMGFIWALIHGGLLYYAYNGIVELKASGGDVKDSSITILIIAKIAAMSLDIAWGVLSLKNSSGTEAFNNDLQKRMDIEDDIVEKSQFTIMKRREMALRAKQDKLDHAIQMKIIEDDIREMEKESGITLDKPKTKPPTFGGSGAPGSGGPLTPAQIAAAKAAAIQKAKDAAAGKP